MRMTRPLSRRLRRILSRIFEDNETISVIPASEARALGVWLSTDPDVTASMNNKDKIEKIKSTLGCWKLCRLGLLGKILF